MRKTSNTLIVAGLAALLLNACGGGSFESNKPPVADAGSPLTVNVGQLVTLDGRASSDPNDNLTSYQWTQVAGSAVSLSGASTARPSFTVPQLTVGATLTFSLVVTDIEGLTSAADTVTITVSNVTTIAVTGTVRFERVPFRTMPTRLDYANPVLQPVRGVVVRALAGGTTTVLAEGATSETGAYSLTVPTNTTISIQVEARLLRNSALPNWNIRVQNGATPLSPYRVVTAQFNSSAGTQNIDIATGVTASGSGGSTLTRPSGPFAILDTIYTALQTLLTAVPAANLPTLYVDWGSDLGAFFTTGPNGRFIALRSDLTEDTDEFDQAVIAHEFGHYLENIYARSDSGGGPHSLGDRLEPSLAFSEGFATAFGAIALNDPVYLDSFVDNGNLVAGGLSVETNPATVPPAVPGDGLGCWCSESSVWSLVWDLYDNAADANDNIALGFTPLWQALTNSLHRDTPALTSIFSYIASLKTGRPADAAAIDALVFAQNIDSATLSEFATTETHHPISGVDNLLPVFADIVLGTPVVLRTTDDAGTYNKVGSHRFLRFVAPGAGPYTFRVTTSNPNPADPQDPGDGADPDFVIYRAGLRVAEGEDPPSPAGETEVLQTIPGATYVIDAYDCANGCPSEPQQGTPGDYDLTVTVN